MNAWELAAWDAVETAERIARKDVSAPEVLEAALARAADASALNAIVTPTPELARAAAPTAAGPLAGVPTYTKDLVPVAGVRIAWGTNACGEYVPKKNDPLVGVLARCGLVSLGKSATPELGLTGTTEPRAFGPCHNPWDLSRTPGGSSGGAAALVAAGVVPIGQGSDGGGSIRIPASCCGLVGLKPTRGRLDMTGSNLLIVNIAVNGVLTRSVRDTVAFWRAVEAQGHGRKLTPIGDPARAPQKRLRVLAYVEPPNGAPVDDEVRATFAAALKTLRELGHEVREEKCPVPRQVIDDFMSLWGYVAWVQVTGARFAMGTPVKAELLENLTAGFMKEFAKAKSTKLREAWRLRQWTADYARLFDRVDVLACPTLATLPPKLGWLSGMEPYETARERIVSFTPFTSTFNAAGGPAISLPLGASASGLPIGVQFAAAAGREALLLELAAELEVARPWQGLAPRQREALSMAAVPLKSDPPK